MRERLALFGLRAGAFWTDRMLVLLSWIGIAKVCVLVYPDCSWIRARLWEGYLIETFPSMVGFLADMTLYCALMLPIIPAMFYLAAYVVLSGAIWKATPGMMLFGLRMTFRKGGPSDGTRILLWHVLAHFSIILLFAGCLWSLFDVKHCTWHDALAGVIVKRSG